MYCMYTAQASIVIGLYINIMTQFLHNYINSHNILHQYNISLPALICITKYHKLFKNASVQNNHLAIERYSAMYSTSSQFCKLYCIFYLYNIICIIVRRYTYVQNICNGLIHVHRYALYAIQLFSPDYCHV